MHFPMLTANKVNSIVFSFCLIDFLVIPRLAIPFYVQVTLYLVIIYSIFQKRSPKDIVFYLAFAGGLLGSLLYSLTESNSPFDENAKRVLQLITVFAYYYSFVKIKLDNQRVLSILWVFATYIFIATACYASAPRETAEVFWGLYPESLGSEKEALHYLRFQYIFQDPNSHAYFLALILGMIVVLEKSDLIKALAFVGFLPMIMATQSRGGLLAYASLVVLYVVELDVSYVRKVSYISLLVLVISTVAINLNSEFQLIELLLNRSNYEDDLGGGRAGKYIYFFNNMNFFPWGVGHYLEVGGYEFKPHSDLIRVIQSYGFVVAGFFVYVLWPRKRYELYLLVPIAICMLINTAINDYRIFGLYLLLLSYLRGSKVHAQYK